nr:hypothetical protein [Streptomyces sp. SID10853]
MTVSAALLLTACGGSSNDASKDKIKGADEGTKSPSASASAATGDGRPDVSTPKDLTLDFNFDKPTDPKHAAALADAENYIRALDHGIAKQDANDHSYQFYSTGGAAKYAKAQIQAWTKGGWVTTGKDQYFDADVSPLENKSVLVSFCRNQSEFYSKEIKTGKIKYTKESLDSYQKFTLLMSPSAHSSNVWQARKIDVLGRVKECKG